MGLGEFLSFYYIILFRANISQSHHYFLPFRRLLALLIHRDRKNNNNLKNMDWNSFLKWTFKVYGWLKRSWWVYYVIYIKKNKKWVCVKKKCVLRKHRQVFFQNIDGSKFIPSQHFLSLRFILFFFCLPEKKYGNSAK